VAEWLKAPAC